MNRRMDTCSTQRTCGTKPCWNEVKETMFNIHYDAESRKESMQNKVIFLSGLLQIPTTQTTCTYCMNTINGGFVTILIKERFDGTSRFPLMYNVQIQKCNRNQTVQSELMELSEHFQS